MNESLATKAFTTFDQDHFALLSGDRNPMHVDPVAARRTQAGGPAVHGMHATLWALDAIFAATPVDEPVASIAVRFQKFIHVGTPVELRLILGSGRWRADLVTHGVVATTIDLRFGARTLNDGRKLSDTTLVIDGPAERALSSMKGLNGVLPTPSQTDVAVMFPAVARTIGAERAAGLTVLSTLVGMVAPGLHSIFSGFEVMLVDVGRCPQDVTFAVRHVDNRVSMVDIEIYGAGISGSVTAFARQAPVAQPSLSEMRDLFNRKSSSAVAPSSLAVRVD